MFKISYWINWIEKINFKKNIFLSTLFVGVFLFAMFGVNVGSVHAGGGPVFAADMKTKLLLVNGVYYWSLSNNHDAGNYKMYVMTSTASNAGPDLFNSMQTVINHGIFAHDYNGTALNGLYAFEYNSFGGYFGAAIYASGTQEIWYTTSTDAINWSPTSTVASMSDGLTVDVNASRKLSLNYLNNGELAAIFFNINSNYVKVATSSGGNWTVSNALQTSNSATFAGGGLSGTAGSPIYHIGYFESTSTASIVYASSSDFGVTWTTSTIETGLAINAGPGTLSFSNLVSFTLDNNGLPAFSYYIPTAVDPSGYPTVILTTSSLFVDRQNSMGVWSSSTLATNIPWSFSSFAQNPSDLIFYGSSTIYSGPGSDFAPAIVYSTTTDVWDPIFRSGILGTSSDITSAYDSTNNILTTIYFTTVGDVTSTPNIVTSSLSLPVLASNSAPSVTAITPAFNSINGLITVTTTVSDVDDNTVSLSVEYSLNGGGAWSSATLSSVSGSGSPSLVPGGISNITSTASGNSLTFAWDTASEPLLGGVLNTTVKFRITPNDGTVNGSTQTSANFTVDKRLPFNGNLPTVNANAKTKLLLVNGVYSLGFTSTTADGDYHLFFTTSTNGNAGTWSQPSLVFSNGILHDNGEGNDNIRTGLFAMDYNSVAGYYGAAIFVTGTQEIWFATSTNGINWSTSTAVSSLASDNFNTYRNLYLDFTETGNLGVIIYNSSSSTDSSFSAVKAVYSTNNGSSWTYSSSTPPTVEKGALVGGRVSGSAASPVFHFGYAFSTSSQNFSIIYASSSDFGYTWSPAVVAENVNFNTGGNDVNFVKLSVFDLDSNYIPAFVYYLPTSLVMSSVATATSSLVYVHSNGMGGWTSSTIANDIVWEINSSAQEVDNLTFYGTTPILTVVGPSFSPAVLINTSTWVTFSLSQTVTSTQFSRPSSVYSSSTQLLATAHILSDGSFNFTTSSIYLPTVSNAVSIAPTSLSFSQVTTSSLTLNWVSGGGSETEFVVQAGQNGVDFSSVSTTPTTTNSLVINNFLFPSLPTITTNTLYYFRIIASSTASQATSSIVSTTTLPEYGLPATPINLTVTQITTSTAFASWAQGVGGIEDAFYLEVYVNDNNTLFGSATSTLVSTVAPLDNLSPNTYYIFKVSSILTGASTSSAVTSSFYTSSTAPTSLIASNVSTSTLTLSWNENSNPTMTVYRITGDNGFTTVTTTATSTILVGLSYGTTYSFEVKAQNLGNLSTYSESALLSTSTLPIAPTVSTVAVTLISTSTVTLNGYITATGGAYSTNRGFVYGPTTAYGTTSTNSGSFGVDAFSGNVDSLTPATPYHYKAFATNPAGTAYGSDFTFITLSSPSISTPTTTIDNTFTATSTILVPLEVTNASIDLSSITASNSTTLPGAISVGVSSTLGSITVAIPAGTKITADAAWDGVLILPTVSLNSSVPAGSAADTGYTATISGVVEIGYGDVALTLDKAARLLIPGMSGKLAGYYRDGSFYKISTTCSLDTQAWADANLAAGGDCHIVVGSDLVVWTKHFTMFAAYTQTQNTTVSTGGSGGTPPPASPSSPLVVAPTIVEQTFSVTGSTEVKIGNSVHKVKVNKIDLTNNQVTFTIESTPITFTLKLNEEKVLDTNGDQTSDIRVKLSSINAENKTVNMVIVSITDLQFSINHFDPTTTNRDVILYFNSPEAKQVAISESSNFAGASFETYQKTKKWKLSAGLGYKKLYVKFRTAQGGVKVLTSEIKLVGLVVPVVAPVKSTLAAPSSVSKVSANFVFKKDLSPKSVNNDVKQLQLILKQLGYYTYSKFTNTYGPYTIEAVKKFQKANKIKPVNGLVGPLTRKALNNRQ